MLLYCMSVSAPVDFALITGVSVVIAAARGFVDKVEPAYDILIGPPHGMKGLNRGRWLNRNSLDA